MPVELRLVNPKAGPQNPRDAQRPVALPDPRDAQHRDDTALPYPSEEEQHRLLRGIGFAIVPATLLWALIIWAIVLIAGMQ